LTVPTTEGKALSAMVFLKTPKNLPQKPAALCSVQVYYASLEIESFLPRPLGSF
jgi:hypothetical protein